MRENGRTMVETLAVLGIMAVMTVGAIAIYSKARKNLLRMESVSHINELSDDIQTLFSGRATYDKLTIPYLIRQGVIENELTPFSEPFAVYAVEEASKFAISYENMSQADCIYFGTYKWENANETYLNGYLADIENILQQCFDNKTNTVTLYFE